MSPGRDQEYFCDGLSEELIDALSHVDGLRVAARSASFRFRGAGVDLAEAGRQLGVGSIVEGSVRKAGDRLRITVQLIDVASGFHRWSQRFDRKLGDIFAIQDEIAASVATTLRGGELTGPEQRALRRPATGAEPYEYFLRGRQSLHRMRRPDLERSCEMFSQAIDLDANYAPAWAGLATVHALLYEWWGSNQGDLVRADQASETAMRLAPQLADAHVARGLALAQHRRYEDAFVQFEAGIRINPNLYDACYYYGRACFASGAIERSAELFGRAAELNPEDFQSRFLMGQSLSMLGRHEEAQRANRDSLARAERALALNPDDGRVLALGSGALQYDGQVERARQWAQRALEVDANDMNALLNAACLHAKLGEKERALELLERACGRGWGKRDWIENDPDYDRLRDDPRFQALMAKLS
jgi:TolB-like protein/tetratricopeptide (TPR) repeat protein